MANPNKKQKEKKPMPENTSETLEASEPVVEAPVVEETIPTIAKQEEVSPALTGEEGILMGLIKAYKDSLEATAGLLRKPEHTINFIKICDYLIATDKMKLYEIFFTELFVNDPGKLMGASVVFQHLHNINAANKKKVELLYTAMDALKSFLINRKKTGFPLDLNVFTEQYGGESLVAMLKAKLNM